MSIEHSHDYVSKLSISSILVLYPSIRTVPDENAIASVPRSSHELHSRMPFYWDYHNESNSVVAVVSGLHFAYAVSERMTVKCAIGSR